MSDDPVFHGEESIRSSGIWTYMLVYICTAFYGRIPSVVYSFLLIYTTIISLLMGSSDIIR